MNWQAFNGSATALRMDHLAFQTWKDFCLLLGAQNLSMLPSGQVNPEKLTPAHTELLANKFCKLT